jgi:hypothetical protein
MPKKNQGQPGYIREPKYKKQNQLDQRGNTFWEPIELVERRYSPVDFSSTDFFGIFSKSRQ